MLALSRPSVSKALVGGRLAPNGTHPVECPPNHEGRGVPSLRRRLLLLFFARNDRLLHCTYCLGKNSDLLKDLRAGEFEFVLTHILATEDLFGPYFEPRYTEMLHFVVRPEHPILHLNWFDEARMAAYPVHLRLPGLRLTQ